MMGGGVGSILLLLVVILAVWVIIKLFPDWRDRVGLNSRHEDSAEETLRQRFARGEIDAEEYEHTLEVLQRNGGVSERSGAKEV
jgi:uncharacterized membrane protein